MKQFTDQKDIRVFDQKINELCRTEIVRFTCQFFVKGKIGLEPFGSGVFVKSKEKHFILTASHVADYMENDTDDLYIKVGHDKYINVIGQLWLSDIDKSKNIDVAIIRMEEEMLPDLLKVYFFLPISKFRKHDKLIYAYHYAVVGFPSVNQKIENGRLKTGAEIYLTGPSKDKVYKFYGYDPKHFYVLKMEGKGKDLESGEKSKVNIKFGGLSGCGLWLMLPYKNGAKHIVEYRLIGIMTENRKGKYFCLIGNKIQIVVDALIRLENLKIRKVVK
ncbi:MAG: hypothetical protein ABJN95_10140 [Maribacter sp.]|uniref:hypothetical protein n=1 Tax=Maribacter sp. TaxID=1897614 RepID=UPI0032978EC1